MERLNDIENKIKSLCDNNKNEDAAQLITSLSAEEQTDEIKSLLRRAYNKYISMELIDYIKTLIIEKKDILERIANSGKLFNPVLSLEDINQFECENGINLPMDYKLFLSHIGNGGIGPGLGLKPLFESTSDFKLRNRPRLCLNQEFPYQDKWNESWIESFDWANDYPEVDVVERYMDTDHISGCLQISHQGHGCTYLLVTNGKEFGKTWEDDRADYGGISPVVNKNNDHVTFGEWYTDWITNLV